MSENGLPLTITSRADLEAAWVMRRHELDDSTWRRLWRRFRDREDIPREPIVLYRGAAPENRRGMSWTQSRATAARFAGLWGEQTGAAVWVTTAPPSAILGRPLDDEVVVDPRKLGRITQARNAEPHEARRREKATRQRVDAYVRRKRDDARRDRRRQQARDDARRARRREDAALRRRRDARRAGGRPQARPYGAALNSQRPQQAPEQGQQLAEREHETQSEQAMHEACQRWDAVLAEADAYLGGSSQPTPSPSRSRRPEYPGSPA